MREVYRGNGFIVRTNDCGELFLSLEKSPGESLRITALPDVKRFKVSYGNSSFELTPTGYKELEFDLNHH